MLNEKLLSQGVNSLSTFYKKADRIAAAIHGIDNDLTGMFVHVNTINQEAIVFQSENKVF